MEGGQLLQLWKRIFRQWFDSNSIRANPRSTTVFRSFISPSDIDFDPEQNGRRSARISLACGILIGSARLAVRRRSFSRRHGRRRSSLPLERAPARPSIPELEENVRTIESEDAPLARQRRDRRASPTSK